MGIDDLDEIEAEARCEWEPMLRPLVDLIRELIGRAESYDELVAGLEDLVGKLESRRLVNDLASTLFKARGAGDSEDA